MKKLWLRICSLVLVLVLSVELLPTNAFATQNQDNQTSSSAVSTDVVIPEDMELTPEEGMEVAMNSKILNELEDERTEFTKEFLLDSGLSLAVVYDSAVHYEKNGNWEEIDNTLQMKSNGIITNTEGVWDIAFPQQISKNNEVVIKKDGYTLSFVMAGELLQQGNLEIMSVGDVTDINTAALTDANEDIQEETNAEVTTEATVPEETTEATVQLAEPTVPTVTEFTPEETVPQTTEPEETLPKEITPEVTVPEPIAPTTETQVDLKPEENIIPDDTIATLVVNGTTQTYDVNAVKVSSGQIQALDHKEAFAMAEHKETVLTKPVSQLMYANVYSNTDIKYDLIGKQLKESIILESYNKNLRGYRFILNTGELIPVLEEDGSINLYEEGKDEIIFHMPAPFLFDENDEYNYDVKVFLTGSAGKYTLTYLLPQQWLASSERGWPVVLDPVIAAELTTSNIRDRTIMSDGSSSQTWGYGQVGYRSTTGISRFLVKYNELPNLGVADVIVSAMIRLVRHATDTADVPIEVHRVKTSWKSETVTWSNRPSWDTKVEDYVICGSTGGGAKWDITNIARDWYANANNGMIFTVASSVESAGKTLYKQFYASDHNSSYVPALYIVLRNSNGLEGYWNYTSSDAGRAGTGHVNHATGNLVWTHSDLGFGGNRMPVSINHIYNTNDRGVYRYGLGYGWRTNYSQRIYEYTKNPAYLVWDDEDGTKHYFLQESSTKYKDEDGLEMTLTVNSDSTAARYKITDKQGNVSTFDSKGRLVKMTNNQATTSSIKITYTTTSGFHIKTIKDGADRTYNFSYSNDLLSKITYTGTGSTEIASISYGYDTTNKNLTSITYKDGEKTKFTYVGNHLLSSVQDNDGYTLQYSYASTTTGKPNRVSKIQEFSDSAKTIPGGEINIEYAHNQTTFTDHNGNVQIVQFNNMGNVVAIQDGEGRAEYAKYAKNDAEESGKGNQLTAASKMQNTVNNLLLDSSFESGNTWTTGSGISVATTAYLGSKALSVTNATSTSPSFAVAAGESCTFSAYVKTDSANSSLKLMSGTTAVAQQAIPKATEWTRVEVNYINTGTTTKTLTAALTAGSGATVLMDCVQAENYPTASRYNLLSNGDFSAVTGGTANGWDDSDATGITFYTLTDTERKAAPQLDGNVVKIQGNPTQKKHLSQQVAVSGKAGDTYIVSGWAKGDSVPIGMYDDRERAFGVQLIFNYTDDTEKKPFTAQFNYAAHSTDYWQYASEVAVAKADYSSVTVQIAYDLNANTAYFDGIQLFKEEFSESYTYDEKGNLKSVTDLQKEKTTYEYDANSNLTKQVLPNGSEMTYTYDTHHNVKTATTDTGLVYEFTYDKYGNNTEVKISKKDSEGNAVETIKSTAYYGDPNDTNEKYNYLKKATDATGKVTEYGYNEDTGMLEWVQYPEDTAATKTTYTYDNMYRMATAAATTDTNLALSAAYTYDGDLLTRIQTGSTAYDFAYGDFSLRSNIKIGSRTLASYTYTDRDNYLSSLDYGNGDKVQYTYDDQGRITKQTYEDGATVEYRYDNTGALATVTDSATGRTTTYYYDFIDRMMKYVESGSGYSHSVGYAYDEINNLTELVETINGTDFSTKYTYDQDNRVTKVESGDASKEYTYDSFGRVNQQKTQLSTTKQKQDVFSFTAPSITSTDETITGFTSSQVQTHTINLVTGQGESAVTARYKQFAYTYDDNGNILTISDGTNTTSYAYDSANQLTRETYYNANDSSKSWIRTWTYDAAGNILNRKEYAYTTGNLGNPTDTIDYTYGDSSWGDLLTAYNGQTITHDEIGNPLSYGTWTYTWQHGRQLKSLSNGSTTWNFTYNADGIRTKRTNGTKTYNYVYNGDKLSQMTVGSDTLNFFYDASGTPMAVEHNNVTYYYVTNIQGDVIAILNASGTAVVEYAYDAWGNPISTTGSMASGLGQLNPLRYRGYVYDVEYEFYYLQSRYYNPSLGRFLNADVYASTGQGLLGNNVFTYCANNPIMYEDITGKLFTATLIVIGAGFLVGTAMGAYMAACTGGSTAEIIEGAIEGGLTGMASAAIGLIFPEAFPAFVAGAITGGVIDLAVQSVSHFVQNGSVDELTINYDRTVEAMLTTGASSAVPTFDNASRIKSSAAATAITSMNASVLISSAVIIGKRITGYGNNKSQTVAHHRRAKSTLTRKLTI